MTAGFDYRSLGRERRVMIPTDYRPPYGTPLLLAPIDPGLLLLVPGDTRLRVPAVRCQLQAHGRLWLPARLSRHAGLQAGDEVALTHGEGRIVFGRAERMAEGLRTGFAGVQLVLDL